MLFCLVSFFFSAAAPVAFFNPFAAFFWPCFSRALAEAASGNCLDCLALAASFVRVEPLSCFLFGTWLRGDRVAARAGLVLLAFFDSPFGWP